MMGAITIHDLDDALVDRIAKLAEANKQSLDQEIAGLIEAGLREQERHDRLIARVREIAAMTPKGVPQTDSVELLREDRER
jgi:predicted transcriptional regulator